MRTFRLRAQDPSGEYVDGVMDSPVYPSIGDTLMLLTPDGTEQDVRVTERVVTIHGQIEIWVGGFDGWKPGSVKAIFKRIDELPLRTDPR